MPQAHLILGGVAHLQMAEAWIVLGKEEKEEEVSPERMEILLLVGTVALCYLFISFTGRMQSKYGLIFLLPILSGSARFSLRVAQSVAFGSMALYGSFYSTDTAVPPEHLPEETLELFVNIFFSLFIGFLVNHARLQEKTSQRRLHKAADEIATANTELRRAHGELETKVAELETMEQAIRRADRLADFGEMSAGLAHEIRTPLGVIQSSAKMLGKEVLALEPNNRLVSVIVEEITRVNRLIANFLVFASPPTPELSVQELDQILQRAVRLVEPTAETRGVRIAVRSSGDLNGLPVDESLIHQCLLSLLMNALDVMTQGGTISIETGRAEREKEVWVAVRDSGPGISPEAKPRIFNPFYTTKEDGTGLGLAIVQQVMNMHGGRVQVENAAEVGAVFTLWLPVKTAGTVAEEASRGEETPA